MTSASSRSSTDSYPCARSCPRTSSLSSTFIWQPNVSRYSFRGIGRHSIAGCRGNHHGDTEDTEKELDSIYHFALFILHFSLLFRAQCKVQSGKCRVQNGILLFSVPSVSPW